MKIIEIFIIILYGFVGFIALIMAFKNIFSKTLLPFQEKASSTAWIEVDDKLQYVILTLMRISGLGFLIIAFLLLVFPIVNYFKHDAFLMYSIPILSFVYCLGLFFANYSLHKHTRSKTPWRGSLFAIVALLAGMIMSLFI